MGEDDGAGLGEGSSEVRHEKGDEAMPAGVAAFVVVGGLLGRL